MPLLRPAKTLSPPVPPAPVEAAAPMFAPVIVTPSEPMLFKPMLLEAAKKRHRYRTPDSRTLKNPFGAGE